MLAGSCELWACGRVGFGIFKLACDFEASDLSDLMDFDIGELERVLDFDDTLSGSAGRGLLGALTGGGKIIFDMSDLELVRRVRPIGVLESVCVGRGNALIVRSSTLAPMVISCDELENSRECTTAVS